MTHETPLDRILGNGRTQRSDSPDGEPRHLPSEPDSADSVITEGALIRLPASMAYMLDLRMKDGRRQALPYARIESVTFESGSVGVRTASETVAIAGRHVAAVYAAIVNHTALAIIESETGYDTGGGEPFVASITICIDESGQK